MYKRVGILVFTLISFWSHDKLLAKGVNEETDRLCMRSENWKCAAGWGRNS